MIMLIEVYWSIYLFILTRWKYLKESLRKNVILLQVEDRRIKKCKNLTRRQILKDILPFFEDIGITKRELAFRGSAETYNVEVIDSVGLIDSLNLAKRSITDFLKDQLQEKRGFKYSILAVVTMKIWKSEIDAWEFVNIYLRSDAIT